MWLSMSLRRFSALNKERNAMLRLYLSKLLSVLYHEVHKRKRVRTTTSNRRETRKSKTNDKIQEIHRELFATKKKTITKSSIKSTITESDHPLEKRNLSKTEIVCVHRSSPGKAATKKSNGKRHRKMATKNQIHHH